MTSLNVSSLSEHFAGMDGVLSPTAHVLSVAAILLTLKAVKGLRGPEDGSWPCARLAACWWGPVCDARHSSLF